LPGQPSVTEGGAGASGPVRSLAEIYNEHRNWALDPTARIPLGYPFFDERTQGGVARGEVCVFMCYSGVGKTNFGINVVANNPDLPVVFFSLEMQARYVLARLASILTGVPSAWVEAEMRHSGRSQSIEHAVASFPYLTLVDETAMSLTDMAKVMESLDGPQALVVIDYFELIRSAAAGTTASESADGLSRRLKNWTRDHDVATLVLHQTNAGGRLGTGRVDFGHLALTRDSDRYRISTAADYVLSAYRPALNPQMPLAEREQRAREFRIQLLKTRASGGLEEWGVKHDFNPQSLSIRPL
jgi:replicative DNA helicase